MSHNPPAGADVREWARKLRQHYRPQEVHIPMTLTREGVRGGNVIQISYGEGRSMFQDRRDAS